jgi:ADP-ribose pyrophosphatase YjhB (NUDIX family)
VTGLVDVISGQEHPRGAHIVIIYQAKILSGSLQAGDDVDQTAFFSRDQLPPLAFKSTRLILGISEE